MIVRFARVAFLIAVMASFGHGRSVSAQNPASGTSGATGTVIFIHPDGASTAHWTACRLLQVGPDSSLHWDRLPYTALYRGHLKDRLTSTSHGGATVHAYGARVVADSYGLDGTEPVRGPSGPVPSILSEALLRQIPAGIVNSGTITEPGTGVFAASVKSRTDHAAIAAAILETAPTVVLGGGESWFLPEGASGRHGPGRRVDGRNLVREAEARGYTVVRTGEELQEAAEHAERVLGLFAADDTYNDLPEEDLRDRGFPAYDPNAPTVAEMTEAAIRVLGRGGRSFLLVVEEEGTDNFGNANNARDCLEAVKRADDAIGVARAYLREHPNSLVITAADSDAGGLAVFGLPATTDLEASLPSQDRNGAPWDGRNGTGTPPFVAEPDALGRRLPFAVAWASSGDLSGGILARAEGLNASQLVGGIDNTGIHRLMRRTLLGE